MPFQGKTVLHVGCGSAPLPAWLDGAIETRLDIDEKHNPDIVADMRDFDDIGTYDIIFSSHSLEHLYPHEVVPTLENFRKALNPDGKIIVIVPNLEGIKPTEDVVYTSPCGDITGLDMIYGCRRLIKDVPFMAHHTGFTKETLGIEIGKAGFSKANVVADNSYNLIAIAA